MLLKKQHLRRHQAFLKSLLAASSLKQVRKQLTTAKYLQLQTLIKILAAVALRQIPASDQTARAFYASRKKRLLKQHFSSWSKVRKLLKGRDVEEWRRILIELAGLVKVSLTLLFA